MKKEWFFDRFCGERIAVCAHDGKITEVSVEDERNGDVVGNIYKGTVSNIVLGMQAAFVSCGMEKNCYLPLDGEESVLSRYDGEGNENGKSVLRIGDEILVQVVKPPRGNKGAKVTRDLSFVGKNLIFLPQTDFLGISRKITEEEKRKELLAEADKLRAKGEGFIVRTAALKADRRRMKAESEYLKRICRLALGAAKEAPVGTCVYRECDLPVKIMRDCLGEEINKIYIGDGELYEKLLPLARMSANIGEKKLALYSGARSLFTTYGMDEQIYGLTSPVVQLGNGADLVIDRTEAMTVIDVNTGKYTGDNDLESTVFETNLLAAREVARQVRLRNIGGIVAVDFIDMISEEHRARVNAELERALAEDREKNRVLPMSDLCVTLFTRKRTNNDLLSFLLKPCTHCTRQGYILSDKYMAMRVRSAIMDRFADGYNAVIIELNRALMNTILSERYFAEELGGVWKNKRVYMIPHSTFHEEKFTIRGDNSGVLNLPDDAQILY